MQNDLDVHFRARSLDALLRRIERAFGAEMTFDYAPSQPDSAGEFSVGYVSAPALHAGNYYSVDATPLEHVR
jgi:hypothetical protein